MSAEPVVWSIAGLDSGGGAGLTADQRAADAVGVHLCPIAAALTAQNSCSVEAVFPVPVEQLQAQLDTLAADLPPAVIKTGLLGSAAQLAVVTRLVDRLREHRPVALVVDPVLRASTGASLADESLLRAYRDELLPRATVATPNRREAERLVGPGPAPRQAHALQGLGVASVCITGGDEDGPLSLDWLSTPQACGWLALPRRPARHNHGTGCCFATGMAGALARGFAAADATVIAKMLTTSGLQAERDFAGGGAGPVRPASGFMRDRALLPALFDDETPPDAWPRAADATSPVTGLYAITDDGHHAAQLFAAGVTTVQLRLKRAAAEPEYRWQARLRAQVLAAHRPRGATLVLNDHWREALALAVDFVHLGQEDLLALSPQDRAELAQARRRGLRLGLSSHSLWELARAVAWAPDYVACGPIWPTLTKAMPWRPQGLGNLGWWSAMAPAPVVGIGGVLAPDQLARVAATGAQAGCVVRGLAPGSPHGADAWKAAWQRGREVWAVGASCAPAWPRPSI